MREKGSKNEVNKKLMTAIIAVTMCIVVFMPIISASEPLKGNTVYKTQKTENLTLAIEKYSDTNSMWLHNPLLPSEKTSIILQETPSFDSSNALIAGANYLKHAQADVTEDNAGNGNPDTDPDDGGWDWSLTLPAVTHSSAASPKNIYGATTLGLYYAYLQTNDASYMTAMTDSANIMIADSGIRSGSDLVFLMLYDDLPGVPGTTYQDATKTKYDARITTYGSAQALAEHIRDVRGADYPNGIVAWDIGVWAKVAAMLDARYSGLGYNTDADAIAEVIYQDSFMDNPGFFDIIDDQGYVSDYSNVNYWWYTLGITGLIDAFSFSGTHTSEIPGLSSILMACCYGGGGGGGGAFSYSYGANVNDEDWQSTAYAVMTLASYNQPLYQHTINQAFSWIVSTQHTCGGWVYSDDTHYPEIGGELASALYFANGPIKNINTGKVYITIQSAIDDSTTLNGHTIQVAAGTYFENQITINKALIIQGAGWPTTIIDGSDATLTSSGLIRIVATGDVTFSGFTVENAGGPVNTGDGNDGKTNIGIFAQATAPSATFTITQNKITGLNNPDDYEDYGFYASSGQEHLIFTDNIVTQTGSNNIVVEKNPGSTELSYNVLDAGCWGIDPVYYMTYSGTNINSLQKINHNTIDVGTGINPHGSGDNKITAIGISSAYLGCQGTSDTGKYSSIEISDNVINNVQAYERGIALDNFAWGDGTGGEISNVLIKGNIINGVSTAQSSFGIRLSGLITNAMIRENQITNCDMSFFGTVGFYGSSTAYPVNTKIYYNTFMNNGRGLVWDGSAQVDAKYNYWGALSGPTLAGDPITGNVLYIPYIDNNPPWETILSFKKQGSNYTWDTAYFGEKTTTADGQDGFDVPKPGIPPTPYIYGFFDAGLSTPYQRLWKDYRHFLHEEETWNLYVQSNNDTGNTMNVVISWNIASITASEYDFVHLCDANGDNLADMTTQNTYTIVGLVDDTPLLMKIKCGVNHVPVAHQDYLSVLENSTTATINVLANDSDVDGYSLTIVSVTQPTHGTSSTNGVNCYYTPTADYYGPDSFTYTISDGFGGLATATVSITVVQLHTLPINANWNLISMPCNAPISKTNIMVRYSGNTYTWAQAVSNGYILSTLYGWDAATQQYFLANTLEPGQGYWCWAYYDVQFYIWSDAVGSGNIVNLEMHWNIMGLPYETPVNVVDLLVEYNGDTYTWTEAVTNNIVLGFVYGWDNNIYTLETTLNPDEGYWIYAYHDCLMKRI
jgi:hypothetical protein